MTVVEAQSRIDSREFAEWIAYYNVEPFGEERGDLRNGIVAAAIVNTAANRKSGAPATPGDFMPFSEARKRRMSAIELENGLTAFAQLHNAALAERG